MSHTPTAKPMASGSDVRELKARTFAPVPMTDLERKKALADLPLRERRAFYLMCDGLVNKEIAVALHVSYGTAKQLAMRVEHRLGFPDFSRGKMVAWYWKSRLAEATALPAGTWDLLKEPTYRPSNPAKLVSVADLLRAGLVIDELLPMCCGDGLESTRSEAQTHSIPEQGRPDPEEISISRLRRF